MSPSRSNPSLTTDLSDPSARPYFLWDQPITVGDLQKLLASADVEERSYWLGKVLREARDTDVWRFTSPQEVARLWPRLSRHLGRRRAFWEFLFGVWRDEGLIAGVVVDLVRERVPQIASEKPVLHGIRLDPPEEIFANKLSALLSRAEIRDLVDVRALDEAGYELEAALRAAATKDASLTPGQLAWVLSQITIGPDASLPGGGDARDLEAYRSRLISRLGLMAFPKA